METKDYNSSNSPSRGPYSFLNICPMTLPSHWSLLNWIPVKDDGVRSYLPIIMKQVALAHDVDRGTQVKIPGISFSSCLLVAQSPHSTPHPIILGNNVVVHALGQGIVHMTTLIKGVSKRVKF